MLRDAIIAAIRTGVAFAVTWLIATLAGWGAALDPEFELTLNAALFGLCIAAYNLVVSLLERKVHPYFGILLGVPKAPAYGAVGTHTPPPPDTVLGNPREDRGVTSLVFIGGVLALVGLLLLLLTALDVLALILLVVGVVVLVMGYVSGDRRI